MTPERRQVAQYLRSVIGGAPRARRHQHDEVDLFVDVACTADRPCEGVTTYATLGLFETPMWQGGSEFPARVELLGVGPTREQGESDFGFILAAAAFRLMRTRGLYTPGTVLEGHVAEFFPGTTVPHLYLTAPFVWQDQDSPIAPLRLRLTTVHWLLGIGITDGGRRFVEEHGDRAFESMLEGAEVDVFSLSRQSSV